MALIRHLFKFREERRKQEDLIAYALSVRGNKPEVFEAIIENVVISLHDMWSFCCRGIVLESACGKTFTKSGTALGRVAALSGYGKPIEFLRHRWANNKVMSQTWEPDWFIPQTALRAAKLLGLGNEIQITNGLGASTAPEQLRLTRNVVAHSLPNTWQRFRSLNGTLGFAPMRKPAEFAVSYNAPAGVRYIQIWFDELEASLDIAIE